MTECRNCVISGTWIPTNPALFCSSALKKKVSPVPGSYIIKSQSQVRYTKHDVMETRSIKRFLALKKAPVRNGEKTAAVILATAAKVSPSTVDHSEISEV